MSDEFMSLARRPAEDLRVWAGSVDDREDEESRLEAGEVELLRELGCARWSCGHPLAR